MFCVCGRVCVECFLRAHGTCIGHLLVESFLGSVNNASRYLSRCFNIFVELVGIELMCERNRLHSNVIADYLWKCGCGIKPVA